LKSSIHYEKQKNVFLSPTFNKSVGMGKNI